MQVLLSYFDAFKFPSSEVVQFRALVTPCLSSCEPVQCDTEDSSGELRSVQSFGKRRRRRSTGASAGREDLLLVQSIRIMDKFGFDKLASPNASDAAAAGSGAGSGASTVFVSKDGVNNGFCLNVAGVLLAGVAFLALQLAVIAVWTCVWQRRRIAHKQRQLDDSTLSAPSLRVSRTDSLCKLYDTGYARRF